MRSMINLCGHECQMRVLPFLVLFHLASTLSVMDVSFLCSGDGEGLGAFWGLLLIDYFPRIVVAFPERGHPSWGWPSTWHWGRLLVISAVNALRMNRWALSCWHWKSVEGRWTGLFTPFSIDLGCLRHFRWPMGQGTFRGNAFWLKTNRKSRGRSCSSRVNESRLEFPVRVQVHHLLFLMPWRGYQPVKWPQFPPGSSHLYFPSREMIECLWPGSPCETVISCIVLMRVLSLDSGDEPRCSQRKSSAVQIPSQILPRGCVWGTDPGGHAGRRNLRAWVYLPFMSSFDRLYDSLMPSCPADFLVHGEMEVCS